MNIPDTEHSRQQLADEVDRAARAWTTWTTAQKAVDDAWRRLHSTPASMFPGAILALFDAHDEAIEAARMWDKLAHTLLRHTLQDEDGATTTWTDMASTLGVDTEEWSVAERDDYPTYGPTLRNPGPMARKATEIHRAHEARLVQLSRFVPVPVLDVQK